MRVDQFDGWSPARSSPLSQSLVLLMYQTNRREPRRERVARRGRSGPRRWSSERRRISAFVHHQAIWVHSCFREGRNHLGWRSSEYTPIAVPVRPLCPTNTRGQHLNIRMQPDVGPTTTRGRHLENLSRPVFPPTTRRHHFENILRLVCPPTTSLQHFENIPRQVCSPTTSLHAFKNISLY